MLAKYHVRDIHTWEEDGSCDFHPVRTCSCRKCDEDEIHCPGEPYYTKNPLKCDFHWLSYRIECDRRAEEAASVIHPEMGRGHSNLCEARFTVLLSFIQKVRAFAGTSVLSVHFSLLKNNVQTADNLFHYFAIPFLCHLLVLTINLASNVTNGI